MTKATVSASVQDTSCVTHRQLCRQIPADRLVAVKVTVVSFFSLRAVQYPLVLTIVL